jgi:hypothetical protein
MDYYRYALDTIDTTPLELIMAVLGVILVLMYVFQKGK